MRRRSGAAHDQQLRPGDGMHPALRRLYWLQLRAWARAALRPLRTPGGAVAALGIVVGVLTWFGGCYLFGLAMAAPGALEGITVPHSRLSAQQLVALATSPQTVRQAISVLLAVTVLGSALLQQSGICFRPAEIEMLLGGPFTRRAVLLYKLCEFPLPIAVLALFFSAAPVSDSWPLRYLGVFLAMLFMSLAATTVVFLRDSLSARWHLSPRRVVVLFVGGLAFVGLLEAIVIGNRATFFGSIANSWVARGVSAPLAVFGRAVAAGTLFPEFAIWGGAAAAIDVVLVVLIVRLDADFTAASIEVSRMRYERLQRFRQGGFGVLFVSPRSRRLRFPRLPRWGGAGPIAWRQLTGAVRNARGILFVLAMLVPGVVVFVVAGPPDELRSTLVPATATMLTVWFVIMLRFDFRGDLDHIDWLKTLPVRPSAIALGQLAAPVLIATASELVLLGALTAMVGAAPGGLLVAAAVCLPLNVLLFAVENLFFLLFPMRIAPGSFNATFLGREFLLLIPKGMVLLACLGVVFVGGALASLLEGESWHVFAAAAWTALVVNAAGFVALVGWAFRRFDPSVDTPA